MPPEFATETVGVPATAIALAGMLAETWEALTKVVFIAIPPKLTTELSVKLPPDTVNENAGSPAVVLGGDSALTTGCPLPALETRNGNARVVPPPGAGVTTDMFNVPPCAKSLAGSVAWRIVALTKNV